jgi:hypothetical protein
MQFPRALSGFPSKGISQFSFGNNFHALSAISDPFGFVFFDPAKGRFPKMICVFGKGWGDEKDIRQAPCYNCCLE